MNIKFFKNIALAIAIAITHFLSVGSASAQTAGQKYSFDTISEKRPTDQGEVDAIKFLSQFWNIQKTEYDYPFPLFYYSSFDVNGKNYIVSVYDVNMTVCQPTQNASNDQDPLICNAKISKYENNQWKTKDLPNTCLKPDTIGDDTFIATTLVVSPEKNTATLTNPSNTIETGCQNSIDLNF